MARRTTASRLTQEERELIVELRLNAVPVREVARRINTTPKTVMRWWNKYLEESAQARTEKLNVIREGVAQDLERLIAENRRLTAQAIEDGDLNAARGHLAEQRKNLAQFARIYGLEGASLTVSGGVDSSLKITWVDEVVSPDEGD